MATYDTGRIRHAMDLMHYSKASNGSSIPSNWIPAATGDSGIGWQPAPSGSGGSAGSNSSYIAEISLVGTGTDVALATHYHGGVGQITSSSSNTLQRGTVNFRAGTNVGFSATDTDGDGEFDTLTISASVTGGGGGSSSFWPLDSYTIDGTYGDHFATNSLSGIWSRRNFTSAAETYLQGKNGTYLRIDPTGRAVGDGYFQTAKSGDWTIATKIIHRNPGSGACSFGPCVIDTNGTGVAALVYTAPVAPILTRITTYSTYQGTYVETGNSGTNPNVTQIHAQPADIAVWMAIRKSGTNYYFSYSFNGEIWSHESGALAATFTVDRFGFIVHPLGSVVGQQRYDVDWFNVIA